MYYVLCNYVYIDVLLPYVNISPHSSTGYVTLVSLQFKNYITVIILKIRLD